MNMSVLERLVALTVLPAEGDYVTLRILNQLKMSLSFTEEEIRAFGIATEPGTNKMSWTEGTDVDIPIGEKATDIIVESLKRLNKEKKLKADMMSLYEKFIPTTE